MGWKAISLLFAGLNLILHVWLNSPMGLAKAKKRSVDRSFFCGSTT
jgi:hypothetical protein